MIGKLILLGAAAFAYGRPQDDMQPHCIEGAAPYLIPHESDCSKFYVCDGRGLHPVNRGLLPLGECAPGTEFSFELQRCTDPLIARCGRGPPSESDTEVIFLPNGCPVDYSIHHLLPHETDCYLFYYCIYGDKVERPCAPGTAFNFDLQVCITNSTCINTGDARGGDGGHDGVGDSGGEGDWLPNGCPANFSVEQLLPHETDCAKYYQCVHGQLVERPCAPGTHYSHAIQQCDQPENVGCVDGGGDGDGNGGQRDGGRREGDDDGGGSGQGEGAGGEGESWLPNGCPKNYTIEQLLPHDIYCSMYYQCVHGQLVARPCAPGTHFNPAIQQCDRPENVSCVDGGGGRGGSGEGAEGWLPNGCPKNYTVEQLLPHDLYCSMYYQCVHGQLVARPCAPGTHFNSAIQECDWPENVGCIDGDGEGSNGSGDGDESSDGGVCEGDCVDIDIPNPPAERNPCKDECHVLHWAHETECDKFWRCVGEEKVLGVCTEGLHYNEEIQSCDFAGNVGCIRTEVQSTVHDDGLNVFVPWDKVDDLVHISNVYTRNAKANK